MPKKPKGRRRIGPKGRVVPDAQVAAALAGRNRARIAFAQRTISEMSYSRTRDKIMRKFDVSHATAERDIRDAQLLIAEDADKERPYLRARETTRLTRIADRAEDLDKLHEAVAASREIGKMNGTYAPKKIQMTSVSVSVEIRAVMSILDAKGLEALDLVLDQVEAAKAKGLLAMPEPAPLEDDAYDSE